MDKQTLSNYGLLTVVTLILAVMLAFATPFGTYVGDGVVSIANGFVGASNNAVNKENVNNLESHFTEALNNKQDGPAPENICKHLNTTIQNSKEATCSEQGYTGDTICTDCGDTVSTGHLTDKLPHNYIIYNDDKKCSVCNDIVYGTDEHNGLIPVGGQYGSYNSGFTYFNAGEEFPATVNDGDLYYYGDYTYRYNYEYNLTYGSFKIDKTQNGWGVRYKGSSASPDEIISKINNRPITSLRGTFYENKKISVVPSIPHTVTDMAGMLYQCTALVNASNMIIPTGVKDISSLFYDCSSLTSIPSISHCTSLTDMTQTFAMCDSLVDLSDYIIPNNVTKMNWCFKVCPSLIKAPTIPNKVTDISYCFIDCPALTSITINSTPSNYTAALLRSGVKTILGNCGNKSAILATVTN